MLFNDYKLVFLVNPFYHSLFYKIPHTPIILFTSNHCALNFPTHLIHNVSIKSLSILFSLVNMGASSLSINDTILPF